MSSGEFHKMHGLGNDFVIIDARDVDIAMPAGRAAAIANRNEGIGCDQLIILRHSTQADVKMQIFNADGGEVEACGNAARCVSKLLGEKTVIETDGGIISGEANAEGATVDMGQPTFNWDAIPLAYAMDTLHMPVGWEDLSDPAVVNVGNPHIIFFVDDTNAVDLERLGPLIEIDPLFPDRINVNVASMSSDTVKLRVWERGAGLTKACGTGACATAVAAIRRGLVTTPVKIDLPGGPLSISWENPGSIKMHGDATYVFSGKADWDAFG